MVRYVVTHITKGHRQLTFAMQAANAYDTPQEAQRILDIFRDGGQLIKVMTQEEINTMAVRPCECWPNTGEPKGMWFEDTLGWLEAYLTTNAYMPEYPWEERGTP